MTTLDPIPAIEPEPTTTEELPAKRPLSGRVALACACAALLMPVLGFYVLVFARRAEDLQRVSAITFTLAMLGLTITAFVLWWRRIRAERADASLERSTAARAGAIVAGLALLLWPVVAYYAVLIFCLIGWRC